MKTLLKKLLYGITDRLLFNHSVFKTKELLENLGARGEGVHIHQPSFLSGVEHIRIGNNVVINAFTHIWGHGGVEIGDNSLIASHCAISSLTHNPGATRFNQENVGKPVKIGNNVWLGTHSVVLPGVTIGDNVIVGAGAVVNRDLPGNAVYAGVPAKELYKLQQFERPHGFSKK